MPNLVFRSILAAAFLFGATSCSDSSNNSGSAGNSAGAGNMGASGSQQMDGSSMSAAGSTMAATGADKLVALTFDDGPNTALTAAVLDKLESHQVPASFFLIGQNINAGTQAVLQRAADLGCDFENHSNGFSSLTDLSREDIETSIEATTAAIEEFTNTTPVFFRPPNLAIDTQMYNVIDMPFAGGIVGGDFPAEFGGDPTVQAVSDKVLNDIQDGAIVLLHDVQPGLDPQPTPDALDIIIPALQTLGYRFVTLRQLFELREVDPNSQQDQIWNSVPPAN